VLNTDLANVPLGLGLVGLGFSKTASGALPLPFDLSIIGMTGCNLLADPVVTEVVAGAGPTVPWSFAIPPIPSLLGFVLFAQGFVFDPAANAFGFTATNGARIKLGI
jgi:hypothetical protein